MEITSNSNGAEAYRTNGSSLTRLINSDTGKTESTVSQVKREAERTPDYTVNISPAGRKQSLNQFSRSQSAEKSSFDRGQQADKNSKNRELASEKRQFEQKQRTDEQAFEAKQRIEKMQFVRNQGTGFYA